MSRHDSPRDGQPVSQPGPVEGDAVNCEHCPEADPNAAVYRFPSPTLSIGATDALCAFHLAVVKHDFAPLWGRITNDREFIDRYDSPAEYVEEGALVERGDLPEELSRGGTLYQRFGLDEQGRAYFVAETGSGYELIETDSEFEIQDSATVAHGRLLDVLDHVDERVGWIGLADQWVDRAYAEQDDGGEDA